MPGHYSHTNRATGTVLTANIYNTDHQNHIDNLIPAMVDDYSATVVQMQSVTDPGELGSESLATTLAGEVERLRFMIKDITGKPQWYQTPVTTIQAINSTLESTTEALNDITAALNDLDFHKFKTGDVKLTFKTVADPGWVLMNDGTIGSAASGATTRANADTEALYTLLWSNCADQWCPVIGGRGASAALDFAANKPIALPKTLGRALAGYGTGVVTASGGDAEVDIGTDRFIVPSNNATWITGMPVVFTLSGGSITGLASGTTYYIIRSGATLVQLASSLANAQNGVAIDMTAKSNPVWALTHTYTTRALGETVGEQAHAMSLTELLAHDHSLNFAGVWRSSAGSSHPSGTGTSHTGTLDVLHRGGNAAMNIMQPTVFLNVMIKL